MKMKANRPTWLSRHDDGRHFQVGQKAPMSPKHFTSKRAVSRPGFMTELNHHAEEHEKKLTRNGQKAWTISLLYKDRTFEDLDIIAPNWQEALAEMRIQAAHINSKEVYGIVMVDPDIGAFFKRVGAAAKGAVSKIQKGITKGIGVARKGVAYARKTGLEVAHAAGRVAAAPAEMREAYEAGAVERPEVAPGVKYVYGHPAVEESARSQASRAKYALQKAEAEEKLERIRERRRLARKHTGAFGS